MKMERLTDDTADNGLLKKPRREHTTNELIWGWVELEAAPRFHVMVDGKIATVSRFTNEYRLMELHANLKWYYSHTTTGEYRYPVFRAVDDTAVLETMDIVVNNSSYYTTLILLPKGSYNKEEYKKYNFLDYDPAVFPIWHPETFNTIR
jgi:hypothetical protein